jgi:hypothetical protein
MPASRPDGESDRSVINDSAGSVESGRAVVAPSTETIATNVSADVNVPVARSKRPVR